MNIRKVRSTTVKLGTGCGNLYVHETSDNDFTATLGRSGSCIKSFIEGMGHMIHLLLNIQAKVIKIDDMIREGKIEIKGKEDRETLERYLTRIRNMSSRETIVGELCEIRCDKPGLSGGIEVMSCVDGLSIALRDKDKLAKEDK